MKNWMIFGISLLILSCNQEKRTEYIKLSGEAQGTTFFICYSDTLNRDFSKDIETILTEFDNEVSTYRPNSIISQFNDNQLDTLFGSEYKYLPACFVLSQRMNENTNGYFDAGLAPLIDYSKSFPDSIGNSNGFDSMRQINTRFISNRDYITKIDNRSQFNFNAVAQGYSVDVICYFLKTNGIENYMVEIGGEVKVRGNNKDGVPWTISLEAPNSTVKNRKVQESISLKNKSVVTSGSYRKFKEINGIKYSHAINPKTGLGVTHNLLSVSVITEECAIADALATAFLVMGKEETIRFLDNNNQYKVSLLFIESKEDGTFESSFYGGFEEYLLE